MANFTSAWNITKKHEGGYANVKGDKGGETYRGISRVFNPKWPGWPEIDKIKKSSVIRQNSIFPILDQRAAPYYELMYWRPILAALINNQDAANILFDQSVIGGANRTNNILKHLLNRRYGASYKLNGLPELKAIEQLNQIKPGEAIEALNYYRRAFFNFSAGRLSPLHPLYSFYKQYNKASESAKKANSKFLAGWIKRVDSYGTSENKVNGILTAAAFIGFGAYVSNLKLT